MAPPDPDLEKRFEELCAALAGRRVCGGRLHDISIELYVAADDGGGPTDARVWTVRVDPTWHLVGPDGVLAGSRQAQDVPDPLGGSGGEGVRQVLGALQPLIDGNIESVSRVPQSGDLCVTFASGVRLLTFTADPRDHVVWSIRHDESGEWLRGTPTGLDDQHHDYGHPDHVPEEEGDGDGEGETA